MPRASDVAGVPNLTAQTSIKDGTAARFRFASSREIHPLIDVPPISRAFEAQRDVLTSISAQWSTATRTRFDYVTDARGQRSSVKQSGDAFADYGATATFQLFGYNGRGELTSAVGHLGNDITQTGQPLSGRHLSYAYDHIGNRVATNRTTDPSQAEDYTSNELNQIVTKENNAVQVSGTADASANVAVAGAPAATPRNGRHWSAEVPVANGSGPWRGPLVVQIGKAGAGPNGTDLVRTDARLAQIAAATQSFSYDADGNLLSDGLWDYGWDAENRLVAMQTADLAFLAGFPKQRLEFRYDYLGRRIEKLVRTGWNGSAFTAVSLQRRFIYDGWNLIAEYAVSGSPSGLTLARSYTWGLDIARTLSDAGGVGALLQIVDHASGKAYAPSYDGNGNVVSLTNLNAGTLAAVYEYTPYGELLRCEAHDAAIGDQPFRFSTKHYDAETGLYDYGRRYYSPGTGRFIGRDPVGEKGGLNIYAFVANRAVNEWDYLGMCGGKGEPPCQDTKVVVVATRCATYLDWRGNFINECDDPLESTQDEAEQPATEPEDDSGPDNSSSPVNDHQPSASDNAPNNTERWSDEKCKGLAGQITSTKEGLERRLASVTGSRGPASNPAADYASGTRELLDNLQTGQELMEDLNDLAGLRFDGPFTSNAGNLITAVGGGMALGNIGAGIQNSDLSLLDRGITDLGQISANLAGSQIFSHVANPRQVWVNFTGFNSRVTRSARFLASRGNAAVVVGGVIIKLTELNISLRQEAGMNQDAINDIYAWGAQTTEWKNQLSSLQADYDKHCK